MNTGQIAVIIVAILFLMIIVSIALGGDTYIKVLKFMGFLIILGIITFVFIVFGWLGLILSIIILTGGISIFFSD